MWNGKLKLGREEKGGGEGGREGDGEGERRGGKRRGAERQGGIKRRGREGQGEGEEVEKVFIRSFQPPFA